MWNFLLDEAATPAGANTSSTIISIVMIVAMIAIVYFLFIRPQKKQEKEANKMRDELMIGDEITTIGGIIGQVVAIKGDTMTIVTSKNKTKIRFLKSALRSVDVKVAGDTNAQPKAETENTIADSIELPEENQ